jgi:hypothetical protein
MILFLGHKTFICNSFDTLLSLGDHQATILQDKKNTKNVTPDPGPNPRKNTKSITRITKRGKGAEVRTKRESKKTKFKTSTKNQKTKANPKKNRDSLINRK